uniref:Uncharacterized protein n=1 Tax=Anguilla anguilla TaxID=7936 RepID=A0A0E9Y0N7_ANGAN
MVMDGKWTAFYPKCFTIDASHSLIHTHTHTPMVKGCHARYQSACWEQLGVRCFARGHFDTPRVGDQTGNPPTSRKPLLPPELCCPIVTHCIFTLYR